MKIHSKAGIALLALIISAPFVLAQDQQQGPGPEQMGPPDGAGPGPNFVYRQRFEGRDDEDGRNARFQPGDFRWGRENGGLEMAGQEHAAIMLDRIVSNPELREKLGVTADQAAKIRHQFLAFRIAEIRDNADAEVRRVELRDLLSADNPDKAAIDAKIDEIGAARLAEAKARVDFGLSMRDALTPDQRAKLKELVHKRMREHDEEGREHGEHDRDGMGPHHHQMGQGGDGAPPAAPDGGAPANPPAGPGNE